MQPRIIAVVSGTGAEGFGLALRFAHAGARVLVGSRDAKKAEEAAGRIPGAEGRVNADAVREAVDVLTRSLIANLMQPDYLALLTYAILNGLLGGDGPPRPPAAEPIEAVVEVFMNTLASAR